MKPKINVSSNDSLHPALTQNATVLIKQELEIQEEEENAHYSRKVVMGEKKKKKGHHKAPVHRNLNSSLLYLSLFLFTSAQRIDIREE